MISKLTQSRWRLSRWVGWFFSANLILFLLIGISYISVLPNFAGDSLATTDGVILAWVFMLLAFVGQYALFAFAGAAIVLLAVVLVPRRFVVMALAVLISSALAFLLIADSVAYHLFHFHMGLVVWQLVRTGVASQVIVLSWFEWGLVFGFAVGLVIVECLIAFWVWRKLVWSQPKGYGKSVGLVLGAAVFLSYSMMIYAVTYRTDNWISASDLHLLVMGSRIVPYFNNVLALILPGKKSFQGIQLKGSGLYFQAKQINKPLRYPLQPLHFKVGQKPLNIVIIAIDSWRFDMLNQQVTPHIAQFAKRSFRYRDNYSGGNCTRAGIFTLFYGLPPTYWTAMLSQHRGPVLIHQLIKDHYQLGVFRSASMRYPAFDKTVFREVPNLQIDTPGDSAANRDQKITKEFKSFIKNRQTNKPFFSFVFYDGVHNYCRSGLHVQKRFKPAVAVCDRLGITSNSDTTPYVNRYKNVLYFVDKLVGADLAALKQQHLLKNTVVIITSDHGEEFNDEHEGYWGHTSAYDPYQIKTPLIIYWPHAKPKIIRYRTTHYDIVPTLMNKVLGSVGPISDYSVGRSLFVKGSRPFLISGSYFDYAIVQKNRITRIYPGGGYAITDANEHPLTNVKLNSNVMASAFSQLNRYFKK